MRIDIVSIFPEYLGVLDLSLVGKARRDGLVDIAVHDLRDWTRDRHRTVDDTPSGGGAGMVMRADIWGEALDEVLAAPVTPRGDAVAPRRVLLVPTPSGAPFTQRDAEDLAGADQLVVACGRYEGIDARVVEHYGAPAAGAPADPGADAAPGAASEAGSRADGTHLEVREFSLGDYVLNGGEVAALVVTEAVTRLLPGVVGNPESLIEESHGAAGLLEYPVYTRPTTWRGLDLPEVLLSGDHARVDRWRRDRALQRTAQRRPDLVARLGGADLDRHDRRVLARAGWLVPAAGAPQRYRIERPTVADVDALADLAALTFPLACPPELSAEDIAGFVAANLSAERFGEYLGHPDRYHLLVVRDETGRLQAYTLSVLPRDADEGPHAEDVARIITPRPLVELSKFYCRPELHGSGLNDVLMAALIEEFARPGTCPLLGADGTVAGIWLGTNGRNVRARKFYERHGFVVAGPRRFTVGQDVQEDLCLLYAYPGTDRPGR